MKLTNNPMSFDLLVKLFLQMYPQIVADMTEEELQARRHSCPSGGAAQVRYPIRRAAAAIAAWERRNGKAPSMFGPGPKLLHAVSNFLESQTVYHFGSEILDQLADQEWVHTAPMSVFDRLESGIVLDFPSHEVFNYEAVGGTQRIYIVVTYDDNRETGGVDLVLTPMSLEESEGGMLCIMSLEQMGATLSLSAPSLRQAMDEFHSCLEQDLIAQQKNLRARGFCPEDWIRENQERRTSESWFRYLKTVLLSILVALAHRKTVDLSENEKGGFFGESPRLMW